MGDQEDIRDELAAVHAKLDRILELLDKKTRVTKDRGSRRSMPPPGIPDEERLRLKALFQELYESWVSGHEESASQRLESMPREELWMFAEANNLSVTAKMPREKILALISVRFREKRQLRLGDPQSKSG